MYTLNRLARRGYYQKILLLPEITRLQLQAKDGDKIERILLQQRLISPQQLALFTSLQLGVPFVNLKKEEKQPRDRG